MKHFFRRIHIWYFIFIFMFGTFNIPAYGNAPGLVSSNMKGIVMYVGSADAYVNNSKRNIDTHNPNVKPIIKGGRTLVPIRFVGESLGAAVAWESGTKTAVLRKGNTTIQLQINSKKMKINDQIIELDVPAEIINTRTLVPLRAVSEGFGQEVQYNQRVIFINDTKDPSSSAFDRNVIKYWLEQFNQTSTPTTPSTPTTKSRLSVSQIAKMGSSVITVLGYDEDDRLNSQGTGFCVGEGLFLTNAHVLENSIAYEIATQDRKTYEVEGIVEYSQEDDIALLKTKEKVDISPLTLGSSSMVEAGDDIVIIGTPNGLQNTVSTGVVSSIRSLESNGSLLQITAPITHGSSGGPVFNREGYVVGITSSGYEEGNLNFAISIEDTAPYLDKVKGKSFEQISVYPFTAFLPNPTEVNEVKSIINKHIQAVNSKSLYQISSTVYNQGPMYADILRAYQVVEDHSFTVSAQNIRVFQKFGSTAKAYVQSVISKKDVTGVYRQYTQTDIWTIHLGSQKVYNIEREVPFKILEGLPWFIPIQSLFNDNGYGMQTETPTNDNTNVEEEMTDTDLTPVQNNSNTQYKLDFPVAQAVFHTEKPVVFMTDQTSTKVYALNYENGKMKSVVLPSAPEHMTYKNGKLYVTLPIGAHRYLWDEDYQKGAFGVLDGDDLTIEKIFNINIDPYDIVVDEKGIVYITGGSDQWTHIRSYSSQTGLELSKQLGIRYQSYAVMHPTLDRIYTIDEDISPRDIEVYYVSQGSFGDYYDSPYHGDYYMSPLIRISPDGKYIFNGSGNIFQVGITKQYDMRYVRDLGHSFTDVAFNLDDDQFYIALKEKKIIAFDYDTFQEERTYFTQGDPEFLHYHDGQIISVSDFKPQDNSFGGSYSIEILKVQ